MPRTKGDVCDDIADIKGYTSYSGGVCIVCDKTVEKDKKTVIDIYDLCIGCYKPSSSSKLQKLLKELVEDF